MSNNIEKQACNIGVKIIEYGGEISRSEDSINRILDYHNKENTFVYCQNNLVIVSTNNETIIKKVSKKEINLFEIDKYNNKSRCLCSNKTFINTKNEYSTTSIILSIILATFSFCLYFGGSVTDSIISSIVGIITYYIPFKLSNIFSKTFIQSTIAGILSFIPAICNINCNPHKIIIGTIMLFIPSISLGTAIRDIMYSDTLSGIIELTEALFLALAISLGFGFSVIIFENII